MAACGLVPPDANLMIAHAARQEDSARLKFWVLGSGNELLRTEPNLVSLMAVVWFDWVCF